MHMRILTSLQHHKASKSIHRFVSIGENCEFGFVQRNLGYEKGALLKWAAIKPESLIKLLEENFAGLYDFQNLEATVPSMLQDKHYGIFFHTKMASKDGEFTQSEDERREIHENEIGKVTYLLNRLRSDLADPRKIFVYKSRAGSDEDFIDRLRSAMDIHGKAKLLVVSEGKKATVKKVRNDLCLATISKFAHYSSADKAQYDEWYKIINKAAKIAKK